MAITKRIPGLLTALAAVLASGCLLKDERHTWYLDPGSGAVTWMVLQQDVRSDAKTLVDRSTEEQAFWNEVQAQQHGVARAFRVLGAGAVRTRILRDDVPYSVITDARFRSIDELGQRIIAETGLSGTSVLERDGDLRQWTMSVRDPHAETPGASEDVCGLLGALDTLRVVLPHGRFQDAVGFTLDSDARVAVFDAKAADEIDEDAVIVLRLKWTSATGTTGTSGTTVR